MSSIINKVKDALHHDKTDETAQGTHGPHGSKIANTADPRVDSDRDHRANPASSTGMNTHATNPTMAGHGNTSGLTGSNTHSSGLTGSGTHGSSGLTGSNTYGSSGLTGSGTHGSTNAGPHDSNLMNKMDPRVDSDRDNRAAPGGMTGSNTYGSSGMTGSGTHGSSGLTGSGMTGSGTHGSSGLTGSGMTGSGTHGSSGLTGSGLTGSGTHGSSGLTGSGNHSSGLTGSNTYGNTGPGPAGNTAGPHKSDMLNKVDPRVDSDLDGSKTVGQDKTFQRSTATGTHMSKDPTDASQVPPSVLRRTLGDPVVEHDDHQHGYADRHRRPSAQENFSGL